MMVAVAIGVAHLYNHRNVVVIVIIIRIERLNSIVLVQCFTVVCLVQTQKVIFPHSLFSVLLTVSPICQADIIKHCYNATSLTQADGHPWKP